VVSAAGGEMRQVTHLDVAAGEVQHSQPEFLPDGRRFLYFSFGTVEGGALAPKGVFVGSLDPAEPVRPLLTGVRQARFAAGHLLFVRDGTLMAQPFDPERLTLSDSPRPIVEGVRSTISGVTGHTAAYSVSQGGVLAYQAAVWTESRPVLVDSAGRLIRALGSPGDFADVTASPDGGAIAVSQLDVTRSTRDLWIYPTSGGPGRRLTFDSADEFAPVWSPDGNRLLFSSTRDSGVQLVVTSATGTGGPEALETDQAGLGRYAADWSRDDRFVLYVAGGRAIARSDLWLASFAEPRQARALLDSQFVETQGRIAPTGDWLAYTSNESGRLDVYVDRFPGLGDKRVVSHDGGSWPRWARDGRELYYVTPGGDLMASTIRREDGRPEFSVPRPLFALGARAPARLDAYPYDVLPDGRFVVNRLTAAPGTSMITVVLNWTAPFDVR
jgi:dipeptidyl aminopeptidase/acylaminoacyl peptidase